MCTVSNNGNVNPTVKRDINLGARSEEYPLGRRLRSRRRDCYTHCSHTGAGGERLLHTVLPPTAGGRETVTHCSPHPRQEGGGETVTHCSPTHGKRRRDCYTLFPPTGGEKESINHTVPTHGRREESINPFSHPREEKGKSINHCSPTHGKRRRSINHCSPTSGTPW